MTPTAPTTALKLDRLTLDPRCYSRALPPDPATVQAYYEHLLDGSAEFPPVEVVSDGERYWLVDGRLRLEAHRLARRSHIECRVAAGTLREARLRAAAANATHGRPRTNEDKRRQVWSVLQLLDEGGGGVNAWSNAEVARHCRVGGPLVATLKRLYLEQKAAWRRKGEAPAPAPEERFVAAPSPEPPGECDDEGEDDAIDRQDLEVVRERWLRAIRKVDRFSAALGRTTEALLAEYRAGQASQVAAEAAREEAGEAVRRKPAPQEKKKTPFDD